ncbi:hypothetical protein V9T40_014896 [Parthenolecanium corni]|uniref:CHK kinase-like domain-containing protein n=1 Tax=Parthenolecanium corni TaxID=536013 RepID=A0AAN9TJK8_9HEMI
MSSLQSQDQVINILKKCFPKSNTFQIIEYSGIEGNLNFTGDIVRLTFEFTEDGIRNRKSLILKILKNTDPTSIFQKLDLYIRERVVYDLIIPRMNNYLNESLAPLDLKTTDSNIIILENLVMSGYEAGENNRQLYGLSQCFPILKALANFHATSHKICQIDQQLLQNEMLQNSKEGLLQLKKKTVDFWQPIYCELLAQNNVPSLIPKLVEVFRYMKENCNEIKSAVDYSNFKFYALCHGDFRKDNILLKYGPNDEVQGVKFIDFQTCFWSTPIYDFMFFTTVSVKAEVTESHFETLVNWYVECLNEKLKEMNNALLYTKEDFIRDVKSLRIYLILNVTFSSFLLFPLDRYEFVDTMVKGKKENIPYYMEACVEDELFTKGLLSNLKLFEKLGLFEP